MIVYVSTDEGGNITGVFARPQISFSVTPIDDADPKVTAFIAANVPSTTVQMWQAKAILKQTAFTPSQAQASVQATVAGLTNLLDATTALIAAENNPALSAFWNYAPTIQSNDATLSQLATLLGVTQAQIAALFQAASTLTE